MPFIDPIERTELGSREEQFAFIEAAMGFVPNSLLTMSHNPPLVDAVAHLVAVVQTENTLDRELALLVGLMASTAAGCRYCQAHIAQQVDYESHAQDKLDHVWEFETSPIFSESERSALRLARDAAQVPNCVGAEHFEELRRHFSQREIVDMVTMIALMGFLNRWNDTMATDLEDAPLAAARQHLSQAGWTAGKHDPSVTATP